MKKLYFVISLMLTFSGTIKSQIVKDKQLKQKQIDIAVKQINNLPDSIFQIIKPGKILEDNTYLTLAKEGWKTNEILALFDNYVKTNKKAVHHTEPWIRYAKEWKPYCFMRAFNDTIGHMADPIYRESVNKAFKATVGATADASYPRLFYTPDDRMNGIRNTGYFRHAIPKPGVARTHWFVANQKDADAFMVELDGDGIWRTANNGINWTPVTDFIPDRINRSSSNGYCIPVDPDDWNHFLALMNGTNPPIYETTDGGQTWTAVPGSTVKYLKRGYGFKDAAGTFKIIGAERNDKNVGTVWVTADKGVHWLALVIPPTIKEAKWFQEFAFDPTDRNLIYICTQRGIIRNTDGMAYTNGKFNIEKMKFKVYNSDKTVLRSDTTEFPFPCATGPLFLNVDPNNGNNMWAALGGEISGNYMTAVYYSNDKGNTWITLLDNYGFSYFSSALTPTGSGNIYGGEPAGSWLGGFGVNFNNPNYVYGTTLNTCYSSDGGRNFGTYSWGNTVQSRQDDGNYYSVSASYHNADNHCIVPTPSGRIFRGSDAGSLEIDQKINSGKWINVVGDMGSLLIYDARVNEFGDQLIVCNTQDNNVQTYSYGRWGTSMGYEGSTIALNPMSNEYYYPYGGDSYLTGTSFQESWLGGVTKSDVVTGNWYLSRDNVTAIGSVADGYSDIGVCKDYGQSVKPISTGLKLIIKDFALCRDTTVGSTLFVLRNDGKLIRYDNESSNFTIINTTISSASHFTVNPDNVNEIYLADNSSGILQTLDGGKTWKNISTGIPSGIPWNRIYYHEGSGDIYAISSDYGIFIKESTSTTWRLWMKGYNPAAFNSGQICYTSQEMMLYDYGRGVWFADLEHPADRFFKQGFKIKQLSNINGVRTFGIDTKWEIPQYHTYQWYVNDVPQVGLQYKSFTAANLNIGDKVKLKLALREAPDVQTLSSEYNITDATPAAVQFKSGNALKLSGSGRMDLGHCDFFDGDFTVEFWINPISNSYATLIGNRKNLDRMAKGWMLTLSNSTLSLKYTPYRVFNPPWYESFTTNTATLDAGTLDNNKWSHVAMSMNKNGNVVIYVNGIQRASAERIIHQEGLNALLPLSLMADGYDANPASGMVDELRIWKKPLSIEEIRQHLIAQPTILDKDLVYYEDFNGSSVAEQKETFTQSKMRTRTRAIPIFIQNPMALCANQAVYDTITTTLSSFANTLVGNIASVKYLKSGTCQATINRFDNVYTASTIPGMSPGLFEVSPYTFKIDTYGVINNNDSIEVHFSIPNASNFDGESIFMASSYSDIAIWKEKTKAIYDATDATIVAKFKILDLKDQLIAIVKAQPAIGLTIPSALNQTTIPIYRETQTNVPFTAALLKSLPAPVGDYLISSSRPFVVPNPINFGTSATPNSSFNINIDSIGNFGTTIPVTLNGMDNRMIPYKMNIKNCIVPRQKGTALKFISGGAYIGVNGDYASLSNKNTISMMGWFRLDSTRMLSNNYVTGLIMVDEKYGLRISNGLLEFTWGGKPQFTFPKAFTNNDIKKWMHIAMISKMDSLFLYVNGCKAGIKLTSLLTKTTFSSGNPSIMLGKTYASDDHFSGSMDQLAIWNRTLTESEVLSYMHQSPYLDDNGLVFLTNFDIQNSDGLNYDLKTGNPLITDGKSIDFKNTSTFPYVYSSQKVVSTELSSTTDKAAVQMPTSLSGRYYLSQYDHLPDNCIISNYSPIYKGFFTVDYINIQNFGANDSITFVCNKPEIQVGDSIQLALRSTSFETSYTIKGRSIAKTQGIAVCKIKASAIPTSFEAMWMTNSSNLQTIKLSVDGESDLNNVILKDGQISFPIVIEKITSHLGGIVDLSVVESSYAHFDISSVDLTNTNKVTIPLYIDRTKINNLGYNDITILFTGANGDVLKFKFTLEPIIQLTLLNGDANNTVRASNPTTMLDVQAKYIQGASNLPVQINASTTLDTGVSIGTGYLPITGGNVTKNINYIESTNAINAGWNLVSNPYSVSVYLNKDENRTLNNLTSFYYRFNPDAKTFLAYDARYFDNSIAINPLEPFFVQAKANDASLTVNAVARKQSTTGGIANPLQEITLEIWSGSKLYDRTTVRMDNSASTGYIVDEDAPKMFGFDNITTQMYTLAATDRLSINAIPPTTTDVPIGIRCMKAGAYTFKVVKNSLNTNVTAQLIDNSTSPATIKNITTPNDLTTVNLISSTSSNETRFALRFTVVSGIFDPNYPNLKVWNDKSTCRIAGMPIGTEISIYDAIGRTIIDEKATTDSWSKILKTGVYVVKLTIDNKETNQKIIIP